MGDARAPLTLAPRQPRRWIDRPYVLWAAGRRLLQAIPSDESTVDSGADA
ncbi:MAG: hypothetical protein GX605_13450 [Chloroflexi bacterium]|nr:hypothetical protein [Chloroflexota bacterium]